MQGTIFSFIDEVRNILTLLAFEFLIAHFVLEKKDKFKIRLLICGSVIFFFCASVYLKDVAIDKYPTTAFILSAIWYVSAIVLSASTIAVCYKANISEILWMSLFGYAIQHVVYVVVIEFLFFGIFVKYKNYYVTLASYFLFAVLLFVAAYFLFKKKLFIKKHLYLDEYKKYVFIYSLFLVVFIASTFISQLDAIKDFTSLNYLAVIMDFINCLFVFVALSEGLRSRQTTFEKVMIEQLLIQEKTQYDAFKRSVDYINVKAHDLKYEIKKIKETRSADTHAIEEISDNIDYYQLFADTGNSTIDLVLTDKSLICQKLNISLTYLADASNLAKIEESDLYILFNNLFDNAIEYVSKLKDPNKRFIRLYIRQKGDFTIVKQENYFEGKLNIEGNLPKTTKEDKYRHGFGTLSMKKIVEKYNGDFGIRVEDNMFIVNCIIPIE